MTISRYGYSAQAPRTIVDGKYKATPEDGNTISAVQTPAAYAATDPSVKGLWFAVPATANAGDPMADPPVLPWIMVGGVWTAPS